MNDGFRPDLWRLRESHEHLHRGEIVHGIPDSEFIRTDTVIRCGRTTRGQVRIINVPLYKLERYEMPKPRPLSPAWAKFFGRPTGPKDDDRFDALHQARAQAHMHPDWFKQEYECEAPFPDVEIRYRSRVQGRWPL